MALQILDSKCKMCSLSCFVQNAHIFSQLLNLNILKPSSNAAFPLGGEAWLRKLLAILHDVVISTIKRAVLYIRT